MLEFYVFHVHFLLIILMLVLQNKTPYKITGLFRLEWHVVQGLLEGLLVERHWILFPVPMTLFFV